MDKDTLTVSMLKRILESIGDDVPVHVYENPGGCDIPAQMAYVSNGTLIIEGDNHGT